VCVCDSNFELDSEGEIGFVASGNVLSSCDFPVYSPAEV